MSSADTDRIPAGVALRPLALVGIAVGVLSTSADPDLWGHVRFGLDMIADGRIKPTVEPYAFTDDRPWINHEWLSELTMGLAYKAAGPIGLMVLKALLALGLLRLVWGGVRTGPFGSRWAWTAVAAWGALPLLWSLRPQIWSGIGIVALCRLLVTQPRGLIWILPLLFGLWANLHGGWIVGGAVLVIWTALEWAQSGAQRWRLLIAGFLSLLATLATPYGVALWIFLLETVRFSREDIIEWQPVWSGAPPLVLWMTAVLGVLLAIRRLGRPPLATLLTLLFLALASAKVLRLVPLFVLATILLARRGSVRTDPGPAPSRGRTLIDLAAVAAAVVAMLWLRGGPACLVMPPPNTLDTVAAEALRGASGRLVIHFNYGQYALWHFGPRLKVSTDGRRETVYSEAVTREQREIANGSGRGIQALERIRPEYVWLPTFAVAAAAWLSANGYSEDVRTDYTFVARRNDLPPLAAWGGRASGCFPGP
jgi:hypothetical protein